MTRSFFAGVSGLRNHQARLDVIANNIANVNTTAFKASRVSFAESFPEILRAATKPSGGFGGTGPMQIGLGSRLASVDPLFTQGNLESTGRTTDLAIQGNALFVVRAGSGTFFTRAGNFQMDAEGFLVMPGNGARVQGIQADPLGVLSKGSPVTDVRVPFGSITPARATGLVEIAGNLDTRDLPTPSILRNRSRVYAIEQTTSNGGLGSSVSGLYAQGTANRQATGLTPGNTTVSVGDGTVVRTYTFGLNGAGTVGDRIFTSLNDLIAEINNDFGGQMTASLNDATGAVEINVTAAALDLTVSSSNDVLNLALGGVSGARVAGDLLITDQFSHGATEDDLLTNLRSGTGASMNIVVGDTIDIDGVVGGAAVASGLLPVAATTTYGELRVALDTTLGLQQSGGIGILPTGGFEITGDGGTLNAISQLNLRVNGGGAPLFDEVFDARPGNYIVVADATDAEHTLGVKVFDSMGNPYDLSMTFSRDPVVERRWTWSIGVNPPGVNSLGSTGFVTFNPDGTLEVFDYDGGATAFTFNPLSGGANPVTIDLEAGLTGSINGLTSFASPATAVAIGQDGFTAGSLVNIAIDQFGVITGLFSNGLNRNMAQISLAEFNNPAGLQRIGESMYAESPNSGLPTVGFAGTTTQSIMTTGALEGSNVDLPLEFSNLIIAQRGFQANARTITTADEILLETVNLKR